MLQLILATILLGNVRKSLKGTDAFNRLNKQLLAAIVLCILLIAAFVTLDEEDYGLNWVAHFLVAVLLYFILTRNDFAKAKSLLVAFSPMLAVDFIQDVVMAADPDFYDEWGDYFNIAGLVGFVWMIVVLIFTSRQRKALAKERLKAEEKEREHLITVKIKAELEIEVMERTAELIRQKEELQHALNELKATQSQLVQSEKMASLGELTAGIAHEIQNPLNFVNNFSDVSRELIADILDERKKPNDERDDELVNEMLSDIDQNLEKIANHGKRADNIVKGMLQHSRSTSGEKEPTDLNALADEYLRLAYHGLRAKDKSFNAELVTDFATDLPVVKVIPQDVGRVLLNLITNAFYATQERAKSEGVNFKPKVEISTSAVGNTVEIKVKDNGNGIPEAIKEKIFQPFFTTKPTGEGTGLGLSLAYDIAKVHGGSIAVDSQIGLGSTFVVSLAV
ncbi:MAG: histidine kinase [Flavobacterium sp.]|uniref:sensor histidine kinase n=1 Tax=Flavobacterium sp. TaxID=239 RepID=UPI001217F965|nr:ATP-binding protein [Flavobacterium sp.]RZJ64520.1 MAG: histidine kinase [Flavobacterium sp.]